MLTKSNASAYNITLIFSLFFLIYTINLKRIKLKMYKNNSCLMAKTKVSKYKKGLCLTEKLVRENPLLFLYETVVHNLKNVIS